MRRCQKICPFSVLSSVDVRSSAPSVLKTGKFSYAETTESKMIDFESL